MSAATEPVNTPERAGLGIALPVAASTTIHAGTLVALDSSGNAVPAAATAGLTVIGRAAATADNSAGSAGDIKVVAHRGCFRYANSATAAVDADDKGKPCYVEDDNTVAETASNSVVAGVVVDVDADGVWIDTTGNTVAPQVALGNANSEISSLTIGSTYAQAEVQALRTACEELADDVRAIHAALVSRGILRA